MWSRGSHRLWCITAGLYRKIRPREKLPMNELTFPIIFMLAVVVAEGLVIAKTQRGTVSWQELVFNLNSGHIMLWLFRGLELFAMVL